MDPVVTPVALHHLCVFGGGRWTEGGGVAVNQLTFES